MADLKTAKEFLIENFLWVLRRTRRLYVELAPADPQLKNLGREYGNFEPILLCISWADFLGGLYLGEEVADDRRRIMQWFRGPMAKQNSSYRTAADKLQSGYRNGLVHGFQPSWFHISYDEPSHHLELTSKTVKVDAPTLIDDMIAGVNDYAEQMISHPGRAHPHHGSLEAFNRTVTKNKIDI
jgi:hypothetical protein